MFLNKSLDAGGGFRDFFHQDQLVLLFDLMFCFEVFFFPTSELHLSRQSPSKFECPFEQSILNTNSFPGFLVSH